MDSQIMTLGTCRFELLCEGQTFAGIGMIRIGETLVRSGRLPIRPYSQSFVGAEMAELTLLDISSATRRYACVSARTSAAAGKADAGSQHRPHP